MSEKKETPILKAEHLTKMFPVKKRKLIEKQRYVHAAEDVSFEVFWCGRQPGRCTEGAGS